MIVFLAIVFIIFFVYASIIISYWHSWKSAPSFDCKYGDVQQFVSVVIAFKDEEKNLKNILNDLSQQNYNRDFFEIIAVNDHSVDSSVQICESFKPDNPNFNIISLGENQTGKKTALKQGISVAKGNLILTTDADCRVGKNWIATFAGYYSSKKDKLIIGPVLLLETRGIIHKFFELDQISITASTAGSALMGKPIMCSGANLAFEKETYNSVFDEIAIQTPSGDDMFLLMAVKKSWPNKIGFIKSVEATVFTKPETSLSRYIQQRIRWISKSKFYYDKSIIAVSYIVAATNLCFVAGIIMCIIDNRELIVYMLLLVVKTIIDFPLVYSVSKYYKREKLLRYFILAQIVYPFYVVFIGIYGKFGQFKWKNRLYKR